MFAERHAQKEAARTEINSRRKRPFRSDPLCGAIPGFDDKIVKNIESWQSCFSRSYAGNDRGGPLKDFTLPRSPAWVPVAFVSFQVS